MPTQKPRNPFSTWRLPTGTINATEAQLDSASEACEYWEWGCAGLVVVGVIVEFIIACVHPTYDSFLEQWGSAMADAAIAFGIVGEVLFGRKDARIQTELRKRSNEKLGAAEKNAGEAIERAGKLEKEAADARGRVADIERITASRMITPTQRQKIVETLRHRIPSDFIILIEFERGNSEAYTYGKQLEQTFLEAGAPEVRWNANSWLIGGAPIFGIFVASKQGTTEQLIITGLTDGDIPLLSNQSLHFPAYPTAINLNLYFFVAPKPP